MTYNPRNIWSRFTWNYMHPTSGKRSMQTKNGCRKNLSEVDKKEIHESDSFPAHLNDLKGLNDQCHHIRWISSFTQLAVIMEPGTKVWEYVPSTMQLGNIQTGFCKISATLMIQSMLSWLCCSCVNGPNASLPLEPCSPGHGWHFFPVTVAPDWERTGGLKDTGLGL